MPDHKTFVLGDRVRLSSRYSPSLIDLPTTDGERFLASLRGVVVACDCPEGPSFHNDRTVHVMWDVGRTMGDPGSNRYERCYIECLLPEHVHPQGTLSPSSQPPVRYTWLRGLVARILVREPDLSDDEMHYAITYGKYLVDKSKGNGSKSVYRPENYLPVKDRWVTLTDERAAELRLMVEDDLGVVVEDQSR